MEPNNIQASLRKGLRNLTMATIVVYLALIAFIVWVRVDTNKRRDALAEVTRTTNHALCSLRQDVERRVESSQRFLDDHPNGVPGIPAATIRDSIENQQRTILSLATLDCSAEL